MNVADHRRLELYAAVRGTWGKEAALTLIEVLDDAHEARADRNPPLPPVEGWSVPGSGRS